MSDLIKYQPKGVTVAKRENAAIERWVQAASVQSVGRQRVVEPEILSPYSPRARVMVPEQKSLVELLRACAVHDAPWIARYVRQSNGVYVFVSGFWLEAKHSQNYSNGAVDQLLDFGADKEQCPCGAHTRAGAVGAVWCADCTERTGARICYGRTSPSGFFQCRDSCGARGRLGSSESHEFAMRPGLRR
jgi:hypothetical protein